jgi:hypothetical protein
MTGQRTLPGLGLTGFWALGSNLWKDENDINLRTLSALVQLSVISATTALPGSPADGDIYIVPTGGANAGKIAIRDNGAWAYLTPQEGWRGYARDTNTYLLFDGAAWAALTTGGGGGTTPVATSGRNHTGTADTFVLADANNLVTSNNAAAVAQTIPPDVFPLWTTLTVIQKGAGAVSLVAGSGVTLQPPPGQTLASAGKWATLAAVQVANNVWIASGAFGAAP